MCGGVTIRKATLNDLASLLTMSARMRDHLELPPADSSEVFRDALSSTQSPLKILVAEILTARVGYAVFYAGYYTTWAKPGVHLDDLFVEKEMRCQGIGRALIKEVARIGRESGATWMAWVVLKANVSAQDFYQKILRPLDPDVHFLLHAEHFSSFAS